MSLIQLVQIVIALATIVTGLVSVFRVQTALNFVGLTAPGARGLSEIRAVLGGGFVGLGLAPLMLNVPAAFQAVGITYLGIGVVRTVSIFYDGARERSNVISVVVEWVFGVLLLLSA